MCLEDLVLLVFGPQSATALGRIRQLTAQTPLKAVQVLSPGERAQCLEHLGGGLEPLGSILLQEPQDQGFRYIDTAVEWSGRDDLAALRETGAGAKPPLAYNCRPVKRLT